MFWLWFYLVFGLESTWMEWVGLVAFQHHYNWIGIHCSWSLDLFLCKETVRHHLIIEITSIYVLVKLAIQIYRGLRHINKPALKLAHASIHFLSLLMIIVGLVAAFSYHAATGSPHLYSIHSWIGIVAVVMFVLQVKLFCTYE